MVKGVFPKVDGDVLYGEELSRFDDIYNYFEQKYLSVTTSSSSVSFSSAFQHFVIKNEGEVGVFVNFDTTATTNSFFISPKEVVIFNTWATSIHAICSSGTSTIKIIGQKI